MVVRTFSVQCNKCGVWRNVQTNDVKKYIFTCYYCNKRSKLCSEKGMNYNVINGNVSAKMNNKSMHEEIKKLQNARMVLFLTKRKIEKGEL